MYTVSQSKVKRAEKTYKSYKDFMKRIKDMVSQMVERGKEEYPHPLLKAREVKKTAYFIITSDRGLAGAYNSSIEKALTEVINTNHKSKDEYITAAVGKKGYFYLKKMDHYVNRLTQEVTFEELLPIKELKNDNEATDFVYETGIEKTLDLVLPMYVEDIVYGIILDAKTAEHSARMNSMKSATDNADEIIAKLQLLYNRARQSVVTNELIDIIGGANAIGGDE